MISIEKAHGCARVRRDRPRPGTFHDIYPHMDSFAEDEGPLPLGVIDPDAAFAVWWNLVQLVALVYVAVFVPVRVAWANEPHVFSAVWFIELTIDCYFLTGNGNTVVEVQPC